ncbi:hypothetical protein BDR04DRAFT_1091864 [Suillus decipiens]|nr:hypothetical protein BDR04DRAFT_1091864 [Suillus decipiens]
MRISTVVLVSISMMLGIIGANAHPTIVARDAEVVEATHLPAARRPRNAVASGLPGHR